MTGVSSIAKQDRAALERVVEHGVFAGLVAATALGLFAMVASGTYLGRGFFTPMYHAAFIIDSGTMRFALDEAGSGNRFFFAREPFIFGMIVHYLVGGAFGALFALIGRALRLRGARAVAVGVGYGAAVMALMALVVLPRAAAVSGAGRPIGRMGTELGWPTFVAYYLVFGLALGLWLYIRPQDVRTGTDEVAAGGN